MKLTNKWLLATFLLSPSFAYAALNAVQRTSAMAAVLSMYALFCSYVFWRHRLRQPRLSSENKSGWAVVYASQTGSAEQIARQTQSVLNSSGANCVLADLSTLTHEALQRFSRVLFVVSTTGEGDAPDSASVFVRQVMSHQSTLANVEYAVLALGDRSYQQYCAFGKALDSWMARSGARAIFDRIEVNCGCRATLQHWHQQVAQLLGGHHVQQAEPEYQLWRLAERKLLNPGSAGEALYWLALECEEGTRWQAGDLLEVLPAIEEAKLSASLQRLGLQVSSADQLHELARRSWPEDLSLLQGYDVAQLFAQLPINNPRSYSIASVPSTGRLELVVRQQRLGVERLGLASGYLTEHLPLGGSVLARIRENVNFHAPDCSVPLILIGNGSGIAGLRAHIQARAERKGAPIWLIFGERNAEHDTFFAEEMAAWQRQGILARVDLVYSRDGGECRYVQDCLQVQSQHLFSWLEQNAALLICGSRAGMGLGVAEALTNILGEAALDALAASGRYRRDIY